MYKAGSILGIFRVVILIKMGGTVHDGNAVQVVILVLDAAGQHVFGFQFKPVAVAVLRFDLDLFGAGNGAVVAGQADG